MLTAPTPEAAAASAVAHGEHARGVRTSVEARRTLTQLMEYRPAVRMSLLQGLPGRDKAALFTASALEFGTPYALWQGAPIMFVEQVLGEGLWSGQKKILRSMIDHQQTAVPSAFGTGKTKTVGLAAAYFGAVYTPGTAVVVTIAPRWRQVARQVWREIRSVIGKANFGGRLDTVQWKLPDLAGALQDVAYGLAAAPNAEEAVQGIHGANLLLVVDEAGGIAPSIGRNMAGLMTGSNSSMVCIGNPPTDDEGSWFERLCETDRVNVIRLAAQSTPAFTGEVTPMCRSCPPAVPAHRLVVHLVDEAWVANAIADHGPDSRYVLAKVKALFPKGGPNTLLPVDWVDDAVQSDEPEDGVRLDELGLEEETAGWMVRRGSWVRLGVDVAADGGDELVIGRVVGDLATVEHTSAGATNANSVDVAGKVLKQIRRAEALRRKLGTLAPVRVKIDVIGVGWGVASQLERWREDGTHSAEIIGVDVREGTYRVPDKNATLRPARKRDEMWLAIRSLLQPTLVGPALRLRVDSRTAAQLSAPRYSTNSSGDTVVESKDKMRGRGLRSPDRAEGVILGIYEPQLRDRSELIA